MNIVEVMERLYRAKLDCGVESFQGNGFIAWIVDEHNRRIEQQFDVDRLDGAGEWLLGQASRRLAAGADPERSNIHSMLADLAESQRKDPKRVEGRDRDGRHHPANRLG